MQVLRIALFDQQAFTVAGVWRGIDDLLAALRTDSHFCRHHIETARLEARDQGAKLGDDPLNILDAHALENFLGDGRARAFGFALGVHEAVGNLIGNRHVNKAPIFHILQGNSARVHGKDSTQPCRDSSHHKLRSGMNGSHFLPLIFRFASKRLLILRKLFPICQYKSFE